MSLLSEIWRGALVDIASRNSRIFSGVEVIRCLGMETIRLLIAITKSIPHWSPHKVKPGPSKDAPSNWSNSTPKPLPLHPVHHLKGIGEPPVEEGVPSPPVGHEWISKDSLAPLESAEWPSENGAKDLVLKVVNAALSEFCGRIESALSILGITETLLAILIWCLVAWDRDCVGVDLTVSHHVLDLVESISYLVF